MLPRHPSALPPIPLGAPLRLRPDGGYAPQPGKGPSWRTLGALERAATGMGGCGEWQGPDRASGAVGSGLGLRARSGPPPAALGFPPAPHPRGLRCALLSHRQAQAWEGSGGDPRGCFPRR